MPLIQEEYNELLKYCMARRFKYTISDLKSMAKEKNIKGYYRMNKVTLYRKLRDGINEIDRFKFNLIFRVSALPAEVVVPTVEVAVVVWMSAVVGTAFVGVTTINI